MSENKLITSQYYPSLGDLVIKKKVPGFFFNWSVWSFSFC